MADLAIATSMAEAKRQLTLMFKGFPLFGDPAELKLEFDAYWSALSDLPPGAIVAACKDGARGKIRDDGKKPTSPQLYQRAERYANASKPKKPYRPDKPRQISKDEARRVAKGLGQLAAELALTSKKAG